DLGVYERLLPLLDLGVYERLLGVADELLREGELPKRLRRGVVVVFGEAERVVLLSDLGLTYGLFRLVLIRGEVALGVVAVRPVAGSVDRVAVRELGRVCDPVIPSVRVALRPPVTTCGLFLVVLEGSL
ncbi:MAG: hypothetical protein KDK34_02055, partial [Leptospiraceae bacterium]|nr:hypothetical protein [Leptospiraceae bacterium]